MSNRKSLSDELIELATEYAEVGIDQLIDDEILRKIKSFIVDHTSDEIRKEFARKFEDKPK